MDMRLIRKIEDATGLQYCGRDCNCGEPSYLMMWPSMIDDMPKWLPGWTNGTDPIEVYEWLQKAAIENTFIREAMQAAHMRVDFKVQVA